MNNVSLTGRLVKDPELRHTSNGMPVVNFVLAVKRGYKNANGEYESDFITVKGFKNKAEYVSNYIKKGYLVGIKGSIQTGSYEKHDGTRVYTTDVIIENIENYQPREQQQRGIVENNPAYQSPQQAQQHVQDNNNNIFGGNYNSDSLPF